MGESNLVWRSFRSDPDLNEEADAKTTKKIWKSALQAAGWDVNAKLVLPLHANADMLAKRDGLTLLIRCSGKDRRLKFTEVRDLCNSGRLYTMRPAFFHGERLDASALTEIINHKAILLSYRQYDNLEQSLLDGPQVIFGGVQLIDKAGFVKGWARLHPSANKARIVAYELDREVGSAMADQFRADLADVGDGRFAFSIRIDPVSDPDEFVRNLRVKAYRGNELVGTVLLGADVKMVR
jgi:hypothetical protein